jgi:TRAP-type C4-dicarboxylate transport system substrate-binding protein
MKMIQHAKNHIQKEVTKMRRLLLTLLVLVIALGLNFVPAEAAMKMKAGSVLPADSDQGQALEFFARKVKEMTNGEIEIQTFHSGELGPPPTEYKNTIAGAQDLVVDTIDYFKAYDDRIGIVNTPFVFRDRDHFRKYLNSKAFAEIADTVEKRGLVFLGNYNWMRQQDRGILSRKPINTPEDLQGIKMRMFQAEMPIQAWTGMGANVQVYSFADTYTAIATGAVDCLTTVVSASYLAKHTELLKYFTTVKEYYQIVLPVMSKKTWDKLNAKQKEILVQAANEAGKEYMRVSALMDVQDVKRAQDEHGLKIITPPLEPWFKKAEAVHTKLEASGALPKGLIEAAKSIK